MWHSGGGVDGEVKIGGLHVIETVPRPESLLTRDTEDFNSERGRDFKEKQEERYTPTSTTTARGPFGKNYSVKKGKTAPNTRT